jgi:hypothetical protein
MLKLVQCGATASGYVDMKPLASPDRRGEFSPIVATLPGYENPQRKYSTHKANKRFF